MYRLGDDWECTLGENKKPIRHTTDESNVYGVDNLEYLDHSIDGYSPQPIENESIVPSGKDWPKINNNYLKDESANGSNEDNSSENIVVVNSDNDENENEIDISDSDEVIPLGSDRTTATIRSTTSASLHDEEDIESSGDESDDNHVETKENYIAIPMSSNPKASVASHLQRLTQLVQSLSDSQTNKSQTYDLTPNELNNFLSNHNIQTEYQLIKTDNKVKIPENGHIHPTYLSEILDLQKRLQDLERMEVTASIVTTTAEPLTVSTTTTTTPQTFLLNKNKGSDSRDPEHTKIHIKSIAPLKGIKSDSNGYSSSQIVINRPEGSVLFSIPANYPPNYSPNSASNKVTENDKHDPYITEDTLKTILELSKQMIGSNNQRNPDTNTMPDQKYLQPIFRPIYYNIPIHELPIPILSDYGNGKPSSYKAHQKKVKPVADETEEFVPKTSNLSANSDGYNYEYYENPEDSKQPPGDHSTIIHTHIPITIEGNGPLTSSNRQDARKPEQNVQQQTDISKDGGYQNVYQTKNSMYTNPSSNNNNYLPYQQQSASFQSYPYSPYNQFSYSNYQPNNAQYSQPSQQLYQPNQQYPTYNTSPAPPPVPTINDFANYYTPTPHLNEQNINSFLYNFNTPFYPTIKPLPYSSFNFTAPYMANQMYPNQMSTPINQMYPNQISSPINQMNVGEPMDVEKVTASPAPSAVDSVPIKPKKKTELLRDAYVDPDNDDDADEDIDNSSDELSESSSNLMSKLYQSLNVQSPAISTQSFADDLLSSSDNKKRVVNFGGSFISYDMFQKNIAPLLANNGVLSSDIEVITCVTGARQPNKTDCTRYFVCNAKTGSVMPYICPPYTAFNSQSRFCDAKTYATCNPVEIQTQITIDENRRIQMKAQQELNAANRVRDEALKTQRLAAMIRQQTENMLLQQQQQSVKRKSVANPVRYSGVSQQPMPIVYQMTTVRSVTMKPPHPRIRKITCREPGKQPDLLSKFNYFMCYRDSDNVMRARKMTCPGALVFCRSTNLCTSPARCGLF